MPVNVIVGEQRGDEGKGRFVDMLAPEHDIVARFNGGPNAGHTVVLPDDTELKLHGLPSGIAHPEVVNVIGRGALINCARLAKEIRMAEDKGIELSYDNLKIDSAIHLILPHHIYADEIREAGNGRQGSTKSGIAQCASNKYMRLGVRAEMINNKPMELYEIAKNELLDQREARHEAWLDPIDETEEAARYLEAALKIGEFVTDTTVYLNDRLHKDKPARILAEGAQGFLLDIDYGFHPYTTSSSTIASAAPAGLGIPAANLKSIVGVSKVPQSHVGDGPFPTEIHDEDLLRRLHGDLSAPDAERGTTTDRTRRLGYLDIPGIRRAQSINGTHQIALTKLDWVPRFGDELAVCMAYEHEGKLLEKIPGTIAELERSRPIYQKMSNWEEDISEVREFNDLPKEAQDFVNMIEIETGRPVTMIGVGPRRGQVILRY